MRDVEYRAGDQFRLSVAHELAHRGVGAEETAAFGLDFDLADAADLEHRAERRFALAESGFGTFEAGYVGDCRDQPDDFAVPPLRLVAAMCELRVGSLVSQLDLDVELDRLASEALAEEGLEDRPGFVADHRRDTFADHLPGRKTEPLRIVPVDKLEAGFRVAVRDGDRGVVGDDAKLTFAVAQQIICRLSPGGGPSKLLAERRCRSHSQNDTAGNAKQPNRGRQRGRVD